MKKEDYFEDRAPNLESYVFERMDGDNNLDELRKKIVDLFSDAYFYAQEKDRKGVIETRISWLVVAIATIIASVIWMIMMEVSRRLLFGHEFWGLISPGFGIIGPYIGASLEIIGFLLSMKNLRSK